LYKSTNGVIQYGFVDPDYTLRLDPEEILKRNYQHIAPSPWNMLRYLPGDRP